LPAQLDPRTAWTPAVKFQQAVSIVLKTGRMNTRKNARRTCARRLERFERSPVRCATPIPWRL